MILLSYQIERTVENMITEKHREAAARRLIRRLERIKRWDLTKYCPYKDNRIILTDTYMIYVGMPIGDILPTDRLSLFGGVTKLVDSVGCSDDKFITLLDYDSILKRWRDAKKETAKENPHYKMDNMWKSNNKARTIVPIPDMESATYNSRFILDACEMIRGKHFTIEQHKTFGMGIIRCKENDNFCLVMPVKIPHTMQESGVNNVK